MSGTPEGQEDEEELYCRVTTPPTPLDRYYRKTTIGTGWPIGVCGPVS